jgi:hypothetical protein
MAPARRRTCSRVWLSLAANAGRVESIGSLRQKFIDVLLQNGLQQMRLDTEFGGDHACDTCGPIQQRVAHGAGDFINRRIGGRDIEQAALAFIERQALGFDLKGELRDLEPGEGTSAKSAVANTGVTPTGADRSSITLRHV